MGDSPPEWAWKRMRDLTAVEVATNAREVAFARYIAAHEEAPVDPLLLEAREIVKAVLHSGTGHTRCNCAAEIDAGKWDGKGKVETALRSLRRGIEIAGGGNG